MENSLYKLASLDFDRMHLLQHSEMNQILVNMDRIVIARVLNNRTPLRGLISLPTTTHQEISDVIKDEKGCNLALYADDVIILATILNGNKHESVLFFYDFEEDGDSYIVKRRVGQTDSINKMVADLSTLIISQYGETYSIPEVITKRIKDLYFQ